MGSHLIPHLQCGFGRAVWITKADVGKGAERDGILRVASLLFHHLGMGIDIEVIEQGVDPEGKARTELIMHGGEVNHLILG